VHLQCRTLPYLADAARFDWRINVAYHAPDRSPLARERLADRGGRIEVRLLRHVLEHEIAAPGDHAVVGRQHRIVTAHRAIDEHLEQRGLAGAVRADHPDAIPLVHRERGAREHAARAEPLLETLDREDRGHDYESRARSVCTSRYVSRSRLSRASGERTRLARSWSRVRPSSRLPSAGKACPSATRTRSPGASRITLEAAMAKAFATEAAQRECIMHADRHVVIPFSGQSTWTSPSASDPYYSGILKGKLRWEICCGCGTPPTPPEPSNDPCPSTLEADSNLETNRIMRQKKLKALDKAGKAYNEQLQEAGAHYDDYVKTIKACLIQSLVSKALISLLAPETEVAGVSQDVLEAMEFAEQNGLFPPMGLQQIADIVEKTVNGEDPTTVLAPEQLQNWNSTIGALAKVESLMSGSSAGEMEKSLEECQGAILVSPETKLSADKYVESIKAALDHLAEYNTLKNDIRDLDTAYPDLQYQSWAACVRRARCKHTPESDCDDRKPPGDWPDVPGRVF